MPFYTSEPKDGADFVFEQRTASLANGNTIQTGWIDMNAVTGYSFLGIGSTSGSGFNLTIESYTEDSGGGVGFSSSTDYVQSSYIGFTVFDRLRFMRFTWTNNSGGVAVAEKQDIKVTAVTISDNTTSVSTAFVVLLIDM